MARDFEKGGYKNLELLRYYIERDIRNLDEKIQSGSTDILSYFVGSLVDILIVLLFNDGIKKTIENQKMSHSCDLLAKAGCIILLIFVFFAVSWAVRRIKNLIKRNRRTSGEAYFSLKEKLQIIDKFDNEAYDGLLICQYYMTKCEEMRESDPEYLKHFYVYEIIHHLAKSSTIFDQIYENKTLYVALKTNNYDTELIDTYRLDNFIIFSRKILSYLLEAVKNCPPSNDLIKDMENLNSRISRWKTIEGPDSSQENVSNKQE